MATGVWSWSTTAASNDSADSTINWTEGQAPSTVNNSARAEMAAQAKYLLDAHGALTTTGAADTYSVTTNSSVAALRDGLGLSLVINATSTGASTLNVDGLGAKAIRKITGAGEVAIAAGDVVAAGHYVFNYDESADGGSGAWILLNPAPSATAYISNVVEDTTPQLGGMLDVNGQAIGDGTDEILKFTEAASPVNEFTLGNAATGSGPTISATGDDTNIDILLVPKGSGVTKSGGVEVATLTGTQTLTNKTVDLTDNTLTGTKAEFNTALSDDSFAVLGAAQSFTAAQGITASALSDGASIATNASLSNVFTVTLGGNRALANPTNLVAGRVYTWIVTQDATGSRTLSYGSYFDFPGGTAPTLTTDANAVDIITGIALSTTRILCISQLDFS